MGVANVRELANAPYDGRIVQSHFRKVPGFASSNNWWTDLSMAAGNPPANFYASTPLYAERVSAWDGIFHGDAKSPKELYLTRAQLCAASANMVGQYMLCDFLLYYPFIDMDSTDLQTMENTKAIERYTNGEGVMAMAVSQAPTTGGGSFNFTYINQDGVEVTSPAQSCGTSSAPLGSIVTSMPAATGMLGPFLHLAAGDRGVRSIKGFTGLVSNGGLCALVLVKPLANLVLREANTPYEIEFPVNNAAIPRIYDGAFLGLLANTAGSVSALPLVGQLDFRWTA